MAERDDVAARVHAFGGRMTAARRAVVDALSGRAGHLTADQLCEQVQRALPGVDRSTIYRNLNALEDAGVVYHAHLAHGPSVYHLADGGIHAHVVCEACGAVAELPADALARLGNALERTQGFTLGRQHFALTGWCRRCARRRSGATSGRER